MNELKSILYLVATPIGNLDDMTFRAVQTLKEVDFIAAEDTRHTRKLLSHFDIHTPLIRYDENNKNLVGGKIIERINNGESAACVSDAGMPAISDPGADLVKLAIEANIKVVPVPGANAALSALICSGLDTTKFTFVGFLPKTNKKCHETLENLKSREETLIFYESPHHLTATLKNLLTVLGNREAVIARELTKIHEEFIRDNLKSLIDKFEEIEVRGEFVIVVEGNENLDDIEEQFTNNQSTSENIFLVYNEFINSGLDKKSAMRETAKKLNIGRREVYNTILKFNVTV
ncbi:MAG: 16S rRNA (cytidine(1402)-2'-O)-methyltransferase [Selenomonadaceae bacterium]|nr:16S rRNA (cytidine(1402)-2'-O)-methyltransferase [Selenomonadaceae bacterium]